MRLLILFTVGALLTICVPGIAQENLTYVWDSGSEGFVDSQYEWANQGGYWGGSLGGFHSARMVQVTAQTEQPFIGEFITLFECQSDPSTITVVLDAYKSSTSGWKAPTGNPLPPDTSMFDNSWANVIVIMITLDGTQYMYGSELNALNGWQTNVAMAYMGEREYTGFWGDLEVYYQTYQLTQHVDYWYGIDNLSFDFVDSCPDPIFADGFESGDTTEW
jgi:hypothetical protein